MNYRFKVTDGIHITTLEMRGWSSYIAACWDINIYCKIHRLELIGAAE